MRRRMTMALGGLVTALSLSGAIGYAVLRDRPQSGKAHPSDLLLAVSLPKVGEGHPAEEHRALVEAWLLAGRKYQEVYDAATTDEGRKAIGLRYPKPIFQDRFMDLARRYPGDPATIDALVWVLDNPWYGPRAEVNYAEALDILARDFLREEKLADACGGLGVPFNASVSAGGLHPGAERLLRLALEKSPHRTVRGTACLSLAWYLGKHSRWRTGGMPRRQADAMSAESEGLLGRVIEEFADIEWGGTYTLGGLAESTLFESHNLTVGKVAPEIVGEDLDGEPLKLSDHRGRVVVLNFWASWCGPCMAMVPQERALAARWEGKPFALLGINGDDDRAMAGQVVRRERMTWRSWWDEGRHGTIVRRWNVMGWPTTYVLDDRGVIRFKNVRGHALDRAVEGLLAEVASRKPARMNRRGRASLPLPGSG